MENNQTALNTFSLQNKIVLITGDAGLYGRQFVRALAEPVVVRRVLSHDTCKEAIPAHHPSAVTHGVVKVKKGWNTFTLKLVKTKPAYHGYFYLAAPRSSRWDLPRSRNGEKRLSQHRQE